MPDSTGSLVMQLAAALPAANYATIADLIDLLLDRAMLVERAAPGGDTRLERIEERCREAVETGTPQAATTMFAADILDICRSEVAW